MLIKVSVLSVPFLHLCLDLIRHNYYIEKNSIVYFLRIVSKKLNMDRLTYDLYYLLLSIIGLETLISNWIIHDIVLFSKVLYVLCGSSKILNRLSVLVHALLTGLQIYLFHVQTYNTISLTISPNNRIMAIWYKPDVD